MAYRLDYQVYRRPFRQPLRTAHGDWREREGLWVRLTDGDRQGWGEVAPLPWFGSESLGEAIAFFEEHRQFPGEACPQAPDDLPACQFALRSAWWDLRGEGPPAMTGESAILLPAGIAAVDMVQRCHEDRPPGGPPRTWKWKIAVASPPEEMALFDPLATQWRSGDRLRLDANGGLSETQARQWLAFLDRSPLGDGSVEFLEQPLPPGEDWSLWRLAECFTTPIALDESVSRIGDLARWRGGGWPGPLVLKVGIMGDPQRLLDLYAQGPWDGVVSSVLETAIGRRAALAIARQVHNPQRALGFGVDHWWAEPEPHPHLPPIAVW